MSHRLSPSVERFGLIRTLVREADSRLRRVLPHELCRVEFNVDEPYGWESVPGYESRVVDCLTFHQHLCAELAGVDYRWSFDRGDFCIATFHGDEIVGHTFYSRHPTVVRDDLAFEFPSTFVYAFASRTAPSQRGKKLESDRWKASQQVIRELTGENAPRIFYIDVLNYESLAANQRPGVNNRHVGYAGYVRLFGRWLCFRSPGCRLGGAGFAVIRANPR